MHLPPEPGFGKFAGALGPDLWRGDGAGRAPGGLLRQRTGEAFEHRRGIACWAASVIQPRENILLKADSTAGALAHELRGSEILSVTAPGINTLQELADSKGIEVGCLGGPLRGVLQSFVGPLAEAGRERMSFDRVFLGAGAVTAEDGICEAYHAQTRVRGLMASRRHLGYLGIKPFIKDME